MFREGFKLKILAVHALDAKFATIAKASQISSYSADLSQMLRCLLSNLNSDFRFRISKSDWFETDLKSSEIYQISLSVWNSETADDRFCKIFAAKIF